MSRRINRLDRIRALLSAEGRLTVEGLASRLGVAAMTIRRDLSALEEAGALIRTHGGCALHSPFVAETPFLAKERRRQAQKRAIAHAAAQALRPGQSVYLDTGTTALQVARALPQGLDLRVFTNNIRAALELLGRQGVTVVVYGGRLAGRSPDLAGEMALSQVQQFRLDVAIVGGDALDAARGEFYGADLETAVMSRVAQQQAEKVLVAMDSSKFGKRGLAVAGRLRPGVTLITDTQVDHATRTAVAETGARMVCAGARRGPRRFSESGEGQ